MLTHDRYLALTRLPALDGLRALAALAVVFFHHGGPVFDRLQGWIGVQLFFTLSGFLITTLLLREERDTGRISLRGFYLRRTFRIMPVYFLLLGLTTLFVTLGGRFTSSRLAEALPLYLVFCNELVDYNTPFGISWTLGVEEKFYLVWPVLFLLTAAVGVKATGCRLLLVPAAIAGLLLAAEWSPLTVHYASILVGCLLALVLHHPTGFAILRPLTHPAAIALVVAGFLVLQFNIGPLRTLLGGGWTLVVPLYAVAVALLLTAVIAPGPVQRALSCKPMAFVGKRSYSLYLSQSMAASVMSPLVPEPSTIKALGASLIALGIACLLYRWVETPAIRYGRRLADGGTTDRFLPMKQPGHS
ncbi:PEP-CTERM protein-sorting domain-containing protein [Amycolatopsis marina]|uniref:PEP-CTERM protein-sorting domain-containing protein n=2 Tax=Amycolatopsis marina TaxID=490629 RepID=A0A1I1BQ23_9PSEU|nr:PEP-CTERM protein-sorting domain-containing protein [Amycolatopsis marina]